MKTRPLPPEKARIYWEKAERFSHSARAALEARHWDPAVSAAVHAGINALDALCIARLGRRSASDAHDDAVDLLDEMSTLPAPARDEIAKHVRALLAVKHLAEYASRLCEESDARQALKHAERVLVRIREWL